MINTDRYQMTLTLSQAQIEILMESLDAGADATRSTLQQDHLLSEEEKKALDTELAEQEILYDLIYQIWLNVQNHGKKEG